MVELIIHVTTARDLGLRDKQDVLAMCALQFGAQVEQKSIDKEYVNDEVKEKLEALNELLNSHI